MALLANLGLRKPKVKYSKKSLSCSHSTTLDFGQLVPFECREMYPGDSFRWSDELFMRTMPLVSPAYTRVDLYVQYYFLPYRLIHADLPSSHMNPANTNLSPAGFYSATTKDVFRAANAFWASSPGDNKSVHVNSVLDYLGFPVGQFIVADSTLLNIEEAIGYFLIWHYFYQDQDTEYVMTIEGSSYTIDYNWVEDFVAKNVRRTIASYSWSNTVLDLNNSPLPILCLFFYPWRVVYRRDYFQMALTEPLAGGNDVVIPIDLDSSTPPQNSSTIEDFRRANRLQRLFEQIKRGGSLFNYKDQVWSSYGVNVPDERTMKPIFLGGKQCPVKISTVYNSTTSTSETDDTLYQDALGSVAGNGMMTDYAGFNFRANEHGMVYMMVSVLPRQSYFQGIPKHWLKLDGFDYYQPVLDNIGEQTILKKELVYTGSNALDSQVFGYVPRFHEYKVPYDKVSGQFKKTLSHWHASRIFSGSQSLNGDFRVCGSKDGINRIFTYDSNDKNLPNEFLLQAYHHISAVRPMTNSNYPSL